MAEIKKVFLMTDFKKDDEGKSVPYKTEIFKTEKAAWDYPAEVGVCRWRTVVEKEIK